MKASGKHQDTQWPEHLINLGSVFCAQQFNFIFNVASRNFAVFERPHFDRALAEIDFAPLFIRRKRLTRDSKKLMIGLAHMVKEWIQRLWQTIIREITASSVRDSKTLFIYPSISGAH